MSFHQGSWRGGQRKVGSREGDEIIKSNEFRIQFFGHGNPVLSLFQDFYQW